MYFSIRGSNCTPPEISIKGQNLQNVQQDKYVCVIIETGFHLQKTYYKNVKNSTVYYCSFQIYCIRNQLSTDAAKLNMQWYCHIFHIVVQPGLKQVVQ